MLTYVDPDPYRAHTHIANNPRYGSGPWMSLKLCPAAPFEGQPNLCGRCCLKESSFIEYLDISWYSRLSSHLSESLLSHHLISHLTSCLSLSLPFVFSPNVLSFMHNPRIFYVHTGIHCYAQQARLLGSGTPMSPLFSRKVFLRRIAALRNDHDDKSKTEPMICPLNGGEYMWIYVNITSYEYHVPDLSSDFDCEKPGRQRFDL